MAPLIPAIIKMIMSGRGGGGGSGGGAPRKDKDTLYWENYFTNQNAPVQPKQPNYPSFSDSINAIKKGL